MKSTGTLLQDPETLFFNSADKRMTEIILQENVKKIKKD